MTVDDPTLNLVIYLSVLMPNNLIIASLLFVAFSPIIFMIWLYHISEENIMAKITFWGVAIGIKLRL